jgi:hypothetical protein
LDKTHIGALRKIEVTLEHWAQLIHPSDINIIDDQHRMGVAHRYGPDPQRFTPNHNRVIASDGRRVKRDIPGFETGGRKLGRNLPAISHRQTDTRADSLYFKLTTLGQTLLDQKTAKTPRTVAALTGLATIGIKNAHKKVRIANGWLGYDQLVTTNAVITVCQLSDQRGVKIQWCAHTIKHDKIIAQRVHLGKGKHAHGNSEYWSTRPNASVIIVRGGSLPWQISLAPCYPCTGSGGQYRSQSTFESAIARNQGLRMLALL